MALAHQFVHAAEGRTEDCGLDQVRIEGIDYYARSLRRRGRQIPSIYFRLDGACVSVRRFAGQDFRHAPPRLTMDVATRVCQFGRATRNRGTMAGVGATVGPLSQPSLHRIRPRLIHDDGSTWTWTDHNNLHLGEDD